MFALLVAITVSMACSGEREVDPIESIRALQEQGRFAETIEPLREALKQSPDDGELNYLYGQALVQSGSSNVAHWSLRKAMKDPEWKVPAALELAFLSLSSRDFNEVIEITDEVLAVEPENTQALLMRASAHAHWKVNSELAIELADRVLEIDPDMIEAYEPRIIALLDLGRTEEAREWLARAGEQIREREAAPGVLAWHCATTAALDEFAGDLEKTRETWERCLEEYPSNPEVVSDAVVFFDKQGEPDRSLEILERAAEGGDRAMRVSLANRLVFHGRPADAEALLRDATRTEQPELAAAAWLDLANLQQAIDEYQAAVESLERAVALARELGTPDPALLFQYAEALLVAGQLDEALREAESLTVPAHRKLIEARVAQQRGDPVAALAAFDEALVLWPNNTFARYYAALAAESLGDFERAIEEYRYSIRVAPGATDARVRCARLFDESRQWSTAVEVLHSSYDNTPLDLEGELMAIRLSAMSGQDAIMVQKLGIVEARWPGWVGYALAEAAEGVSRRSGPAVALQMLMTAPGVDYAQPVYTPALRALVEFAYEADRVDAVRGKLDEIYATRPDDGWLAEVRARDLELAGADAGAIEAAYARALELVPQYAPALEGRARAALRAGDLEAAIGLYDRAAAADAKDPGPVVEAARLRVELGRVDEAAARLDATIADHPWAGRAAAERAAIDLARGTVTDRTGDLARRAVRFGGGADELEVLARVYAALGDEERAEQAQQTAKRLREKAAAAS